MTDVQKIKENYMATQDFSFDLAAVLPLCISYGVAMEIYQHTTYLLTGSEYYEKFAFYNLHFKICISQFAFYNLHFTLNCTLHKKLYNIVELDYQITLRSNLS